MIAVLRRWYYRLWPPPEDQDLIGRRVRRGIRVNGAWRYNRQEGVIVGSWVDFDRRMYRILLDDRIGIVSTTLPVDEYLVTEERVDTSRFTVDDKLPEMHLSRTGGWYRPGGGYCEYYRPRTPWAKLTQKARWRCRQWYYRRWPTPENPAYIGKQVRFVRPVHRKAISFLGENDVGVVIGSEPYYHDRLYHVIFREERVTLRESWFELVTDTEDNPD